MTARARWSIAAGAAMGALLAAGGLGAQAQPGREPAQPRALTHQLASPNVAAPTPGAPGQRGSPTPGERARGTAAHGIPEPRGSATRVDDHGVQPGHREHEGTSAHAEHDEKAPPPPINWWHGILGEKQGAEPGLLWREPGEPPPYLASLLNFGLLVFVVVKFGKKPLSDALAKRKEGIVRDLEEAGRLREAAEKRLAEYQAKLEKIHEDLERLRRQFREQGELEKERIVSEANERRERMKRDAEVLLAQETKQMRQDLVIEVVREASRLATELLAKEMTLGDHDRFAETFLAELRSGGKARGFGAVAASAAARGSQS